MKGGQLRPERQIGQVGAELIGADGAAADVEAIALAAEALGRARYRRALGRPHLAAPRPGDLRGARRRRARRREVRAALDHKDAAKLAGIGGAAAPLLGKLLAAAGPAATALAALAPLAMPRGSRRRAGAARRGGRRCSRRRRPISGSPSIRSRAAASEYDTGISFSFFARRGRAELGRGGRYVAGNGQRAGRAGDRLHPLYRHRARRRAAAGGAAPPLSAAGAPRRGGAALARRRLGHGRRPRAEADIAAAASASTPAMP